MSEGTPILPPTRPVDVAASPPPRTDVPAEVVEDVQEALPPPRERPQRIPAEVVVQNEDGTITVRTEAGEVELRPQPPQQQQAQPQAQQIQTQAPNPQPVPQQPSPPPPQISTAAIGAQIEIEIPAQPVQQAAQTAQIRTQQVIIRLESALVQNTLVQNVSTPQNNPIPPSRITATPLQITVGDINPPPQPAAPLIQTAAPQVALNPQTGLPQIGETVRLVPVTPDFLATLQRPVITETQSFILSTPQNNLIQPTLLSTPNEPALQAPPLQSTAPPRVDFVVTPPSLTTVNFPAVTPLLQPTQEIPVPVQTRLPNLPQTILVQTQNLPSTPPSQPMTAPLSPIPNVVFTPSLPESVPLNTVLQNVTPPSVTLNAPPLTTLADISVPVSDEIQTQPISREPQPQTIPARFEGLAPQGQPVFAVQLPSLIDAPPPLYIMDYALNDQARTALESLPQGTRTELSFTQSPTQNLPVQATLSTPLAMPVFSTYLTPEIWPAANDLYQSVLQISAQAAQAMSNITPSPANPAQFGPAVLFFVAAVRSGDLSGWLGEKNIQLLQKAGKNGQLSRLLGDGQNMGRLASEQVTQDWRALSIPLMHDHKIEKIALYYKSEDYHDEESSESKGGFNRFIFNLNLDQMGPVQLDGLFRGQKLDLAVRTQQQFSEAMRQDMRRIYVHTLEVAGMSGELSFQNRDSWVTITPDQDRFGVSA